MVGQYLLYTIQRGTIVIGQTLYPPDLTLFSQIMTEQHPLIYIYFQFNYPLSTVVPFKPKPYGDFREYL